MAKILIVEDEILAIKHLSVVLHSLGHGYGFITKSEFLFKRLAAEEFDLILMDLNMPGMDGKAMLEKLQEHSQFRKIPVIMLTAETEESAALNCFELGAKDFITKPAKEIILKARIENVMAIRGSAQALENQVHVRNRQLEVACNQLKKLNQSMQVFVPLSFQKRILENVTLNKQFSEEIELSILFVDIRSFTALAELMSNEGIFEFLNSFFTLVEPCITNNHGFVDKFTGDGVMALFDEEDSANQAVQAAIDIQRAMVTFNQARVEQGLKAIRVGTGINTGNVLMGMLGGQQRMDSTVIGDHVNLASRLEGLTKRFKAQILISHWTHAKINPELFLVREIDTLRVRGKQEPVLVYEVFSADAPEVKDKKNETKDRLFSGIALYKSYFFQNALDIFLECLDIFSEDGVTINYIKRCRYFLKFPPPLNQQMTEEIIHDWDGIIDHAVLRRGIRCLIQTPAKVFLTPNQVYTKQVETEVLANVLDCSITGMRIEMEQYLNVGAVIRVELLFQESVLAEIRSQEELAVIGQVMWNKNITKANDEFSWRYGVEFIMMPLEQEQILEETLEHIGKQCPELVV